MDFVLLHQLLFRLPEGDVVLLRVFLGHEMLPEIVVEVFVEQRAVHVEEDEVDIIHRDYAGVHEIIISYEVKIIYFCIEDKEGKPASATICKASSLLKPCLISAS